MNKQKKNLYLPHTFSLYFERDNFVPSHESKYRCKRKEKLSNCVSDKSSLC